MTEEEGTNTRLKKIIDYINNGLPVKKQIYKYEKIDSNINGIISMFENYVPIKQKKGRYKLPFKVKSGMRRYYKKNKILVFLLRGNNTFFPIVKQMVNMMININGNLHSIPPDCVMMYRGKTPCIVLPEWQVTPFQPLKTSEIYQKAEGEHNLVEAQSFIIRAIKKAQVPDMIRNKIFSPMGIIGVVIVVGLGWYIFFGG